MAEAPETEQPIVATTESPSPTEPADDAVFHMRPRRRRRSKAEMAESVSGGESAGGSGSESVGQD